MHWKFEVLGVVSSEECWEIWRQKGRDLQGGVCPLQSFEGFSDILHEEKNEWEGREALWRKEQRVQDRGHCRKIKYEAQVQGSP